MIKKSTADVSRTILIVDDDTTLAEMLSIVLEDYGYVTRRCEDGLRAVELVSFLQPDLVILDVMLPGLSGVEVAQKIRGFSSVPIIMLTARVDTTDVVAGLESGADDYMTKPFDVEELVARIRSRFRAIDRTASPDAQHDKALQYEQSRIMQGTFVLDISGHTVTKDGQPIHLTPIEFELLRHLMAHTGEVLSRSELLQRVWGYKNSTDIPLVNVCVQRLRSKIEDAPDTPEHVLTVRGVGYKFVA